MQSNNPHATRFYTACIVGMGAEPAGNSPAEFSVFIKREIGALAKVIRDVGITVE